MDNKSHKDKMDQFFDQSWDDSKLSGDMPDFDQSWSVIQDEIQPDDRRKFFWPIFLRGLIVVVLLLFGFVFLVQDKDEVELISSTELTTKGSEKSSISVDEINGQSKEIKAEPSISETEVKSEIEPAKREVEGNSVPVIDNNTNNTSNLQENDAEQQQKLSASLMDQGSSMISDDDKDDVHTDEPLTNIGAIQENENRPTGTFDRLHTLQSNIMFEPGELFISDNTGNVVNSTVKGDWALRINAGAGIFVFPFREGDVDLSGLNLSIEDANFISTALVLEKQVNARGKVTGQLAYRRHTFTAHYELGVKYTSNGEFQDGEGNWHNQYTHTLPTLFGPSPMDHVLYRNKNEVISEGESIPFALYLKHKIHDLNFGLGYQWRILDSKWNIDLGILSEVGYWIADNDIDQVVLASHHEKIHHNFTSFSLDEAQLESPHYINLGADANISRDLTTHSEIGLNLHYRAGLISPKLYNSASINQDLFGAQLFWRFNF